jgi:hypothetical protein
MDGRFWPIPVRGHNSRPASAGRFGYAIGSDLSLLCNLKGIIYLDPKIPYGAFKLSMPKKQLNCSKIFRSPVDESGFCSSHRMCLVSRRIQADRFHPPGNDACVLAGR